MQAETAKSESVTDRKWLERAVTHYHRRLLEIPLAQDLLRAKGVTAPEAVTAFRIGYSDGTLIEILPIEGREALTKAGVLREDDQELMRGCIVFPLVAPQTGEVINLYGYNVETNKHLYLSGGPHGLFNPQGARAGTEEVILTNTAMDAAVLWSAGFYNTIPIHSQTKISEEVMLYLEECLIKTAIILVEPAEDAETSIEQIAARLQQSNIGIRVVRLPAQIMDASLTDEIRDALRHSLASAPTANYQTQNDQPETQIKQDGTIVVTTDGREYRIKGLSPVGLDRLRVNVRVRVENSFHLDTFDLYQARSRAHFAQEASRICGVPEQVIGQDMLRIIERLEAIRIEMRRAGERNQTAPMTQSEKEAALAFLRDSRLPERIVEDFGLCGLVGERSTVLTAYLAAVSRKLAEPLGLLIVARSGAGKSALQDVLHAFVPPEDAVRVTRLTGQALFYKDPHSLQRKILVIAEEEGAAQAVYSLRTLASDQRLSIAATRNDPNTGKLHTEHYEIYGPVVIVITTTSAEAFDEETRSRFVQLTMDESMEQTRRILEMQRRCHTLEGVLERAQADEVRQLHHNAQRLLQPLEVVNPYVDYLTYPSERLIHRREQKKYLTLINAIALLHQHQREIKRAVRGDAEIEYVEVALEDIALANELARDVLGRSQDELSPPARNLYQEIRKLCVRRAKEMNCSPRQVQVSRREIREETGWSDWQVRVYCRQLVEMEYLYAISGANGRKYTYELAFDEKDEEANPLLRGLVDVEQLRRRLNRESEA